MKWNEEAWTGINVSLYIRILEKKKSTAWEITNGCLYIDVPIVVKSIYNMGTESVV